MLRPSSALAGLAAIGFVACTLGTSGTAEDPGSPGVNGPGASTSSAVSASGSTVTSSGATTSQSTATSSTSTGAGGAGGSGGSGSGGAPADPDMCPGQAVSIGYASDTIIQGDTSTATDDANGNCGGDGSADLVFAVTPTADGNLKAVVSGGGWSTVVYARTTCADGGTEVGCDAASPSDTLINVKKGMTYYVFVDGQKGAHGMFSLLLSLSKCGDGDACTNACKVLCTGSDTYEDPATLHCYRHVKNAKGWADARADCTAWGGDLAALSTTTEQAFITMATGKDLNGEVWLGGNDQAVKSTWVWSNGEPWVEAQSHWNGGEPNNLDDEKCIERRSDGSWNNGDCGGDSYDPFCERAPSGQ